MSKPINIDRAWAVLFARLVLGLIFFMAGIEDLLEDVPASPNQRKI